MRKQKRSIWLTMFMAFVAAPLYLPRLFAGDLEPPAGPVDSTMHTLDEIYDVLTEDCVPCPPCPPCPPYSLEAGVPKTGQTLSYRVGDDGDLQMGVEWPTPRFTDNADGTVTDDLTGLIWTRDANCDGKKIWEEALSFCNGLQHGSCGLRDGSNTGDWRLPNIRELQSLIDYGNYNPPLPSGHPFANVQVSEAAYMTSSSYAANPDKTLLVFLNYGYVTNHLKSFDHWAWCVRGGQ